MIPVVAAGLAGVPYLVNFVLDSSAADTRWRAAERIEAHKAAGMTDLNLHDEPAAWSIPPFDLWHWTAELRGEQSREKVRVHTLAGDYLGPDGHWLIRGPFSTPISWANKPVQVLDLNPE